MKDNFGRSLTLVLASEGGYVDHPRDPGGATNRGVTLATLSAWRGRPCSKAEVKALTQVEAGDIYRAKYWNNVRADELPVGVDFVVFDYAVNSGPSAASKTLQRVVGVTADGIIGAFTIRAVTRYIAVHGAARLIGAYCDRRLSFLKSLNNWLTFGRGWGSRVEKVRTEALKMLPHSPQN